MNSYKIIISDINGKVIRMMNNNSAITIIDVSNLNNGIYFLQLINGKNIHNSRIVISH
jgi:hypothetical protein